MIYKHPYIVYTKKITDSPEGRAYCTIDLLFDELLNKVYLQTPFFDFGKSSNGDGHDLNEALIFQKEGFGGRGVCYDWYSYLL